MPPRLEGPEPTTQEKPSRIRRRPEQRAQPWRFLTHKPREDTRRKWPCALTGTPGPRVPRGERNTLRGAHRHRRRLALGPWAPGTAFILFPVCPRPGDRADLHG